MLAAWFEGKKRCRAERCESELVRRGVWKPWLEMGILKTEFSIGVLFVLFAGIGKY